MVHTGIGSTAFDMPGGESSGPVHPRPIDLAHLARQTLGDREVEREVLSLFVQQALAVRDRIGKAPTAERLSLVHALKGAARGVGAFAIAVCAEAFEKRPGDGKALARLSALIDEACDFTATINR